MSTTIQFLRSDIVQQRPDPSVLANGVPMVNLFETEPGLFFAARDGSLFKVGPTAVGDFAPNSAPQGFPGNCLGELWVDTSGFNPELKFFDGSAFVPAFTPPQTVTSVGLSFSDLFSVVGSPVTTSGTLAASLVDQASNTVFAGPDSGLGGVPSFRPLVSNDIPVLPASKITSGIFDSGRIPALDASKISTGVFVDSLIPGLNASKITSGTLPFTRGGTGISNTPQNGDLLIGNGTGWSLSTLTVSSNLNLTSGVGTISLSVSDNPDFSSVIFKDGLGDTLTLAAPNITVPYTLNLPSSDGTNGAILTTNGAGQLSFQTSLFGLASIGGSGSLTINAGGGSGNIVLAPTGSGSISASSRRITNLAPPTLGSDATNKAYVDAIAAGIQPKAQVEAASTSNIDLATGGLLTVDTVPLLAGERVLVKNQTFPEENGIYEAAAGPWVRSSDANTFSELVGATTFVAGGFVNIGKTFLCDSPPGGTINVDPVNWVIFSSGLGTVTSVGISMPGDFSVTNSPVTSSGTLTVNYTSQTANLVLAGPTGGGAATPSFRNLVAADIPSTLNSHTFTGSTIFQDIVTLGDAATDLVTVVGNATFQNSSTFQGVATFQNNVSFDGGVELGNANTDLISINGAVDTDVVPSGTVNLGSSTARWNNIWTNDLNMSNEGGANEIDGTWGAYTIQEGEDDLFLINRRTGKRYKFLIQEV